MFKRLLPIGYAWMVVQGLLSVLLPRQTLKLSGKVLLAGYENPEDLEPTDWYVKSTRVSGLGLLVTGITGLLVGQVIESDDSDEEHRESEKSESDDPIEVDI
jgi:hypothetical protein